MDYQEIENRPNQITDNNNNDNIENKKQLTTPFTQSNTAIPSLEDEYFLQIRQEFNIITI